MENIESVSPVNTEVQTDVAVRGQNASVVAIDDLPFVVAGEVGRGLDEPIQYHCEEWLEHKKFSQGEYHEIANEAMLQFGKALQTRDALPGFDEFTHRVHAYQHYAEQAGVTIIPLWLGDEYVERAIGLAKLALQGTRHRVNPQAFDEGGEPLFNHAARIGVSLILLSKNPDLIAAGFLCHAMHLSHIANMEHYLLSNGISEATVYIAKHVQFAPVMNLHQLPNSYCNQFNAGPSVMFDCHTSAEITAKLESIDTIEVLLLQLVIALDVAIIKPSDHIYEHTESTDRFRNMALTVISSAMELGKTRPAFYIDINTAINVGGFAVRLNGMEETISKQNDEKVMERVRSMMAGFNSASASSRGLALVAGGSTPTPAVITEGQKRKHPKSGMHYTEAERKKIAKQRQAAKRSRKARKSR